MQKVDKLDAMFGMQKSLELLVAEKRNVRTLSPDGEVDDIIVAKCCTAIIHEATELQDLTNWDPAQPKKIFDEKKARQELIDIWHFVVHAAIELNMTPDQFLEEYSLKWKENNRRMNTNY